MSTAEQRRHIARNHARRMRTYLKNNVNVPQCAYCGITARNYLQANLLELADGGLICDRCVREAQRGAKMTRDVT